MCAEVNIYSNKEIRTVDSIKDLKLFLTKDVIYEKFYIKEGLSEDSCLCPLNLEETFIYNGIKFEKEDTGDYKLYL